MDTFTIRDLRERTGDLVRGAEAGKLSIVTKHGQPVFVAVPFDETLVKEGVRIDLAIKLFDENVLSTGQAARLAGLPLAEFLKICSEQGVPVVRYEPEEIEAELKAVDELRRR
jgi:prevent-host-death family protein